MIGGRLLRADKFCQFVNPFSLTHCKGGGEFQPPTKDGMQTVKIHTRA